MTTATTVAILVVAIRVALVLATRMVNIAVAQALVLTSVGLKVASIHAEAVSRQFNVLLHNNPLDIFSKGGLSHGAAVREVTAVLRQDTVQVDLRLAREGVFFFGISWFSIVRAGTGVTFLRATVQAIIEQVINRVVRTGLDLAPVNENRHNDLLLLITFTTRVDQAHFHIETLAIDGVTTGADKIEVVQAVLFVIEDDVVIRVVHDH